MLYPMNTNCSIPLPPSGVEYAIVEHRIGHRRIIRRSPDYVAMAAETVKRKKNAGPGIKYQLTIIKTKHILFN